MQPTGLFFAVLLAIYGLVSAAGADTCTTGVTVFRTGTITMIIKPTATVYLYGNTSYSPSAWKTALNSTIRAVTSVSASSSRHSLTSTIWTDENATNIESTVTNASSYLSHAQTFANASTHGIPNLGGPAKFQPSSQDTNTFGLPSHSSIYSTSTLTEEATITEQATITCTIGQTCPETGPSSGSGSIAAGTFEVTSSTSTRTITVQLDSMSSKYPAAITQLTPRPLTSLVGPSANATKLLASNTSVNAAEGGLSNSTSALNAPVSNTTAYTSPILSLSSSSSSSSSSTSSSLGVLLTTSVVVVPQSNPETSQTMDAPQTTAAESGSVVVLITSTVTANSSPTPSVQSGAGRKVQPPRVFGFLVALASSFGKASAQSASNTIYSTATYPPPCPTSDICLTTTTIPTVTITASDCASTGESNCISSQSFSSVAVRLRPGTPFMMPLWSTFFTGSKVARGDRIAERLTATTTTIAITVYRNENTVTSTEISNSTTDSSTQLAQNSMASSSSVDPKSGFKGGIIAPTSTLALSKPGSAPSITMSPRPSAGAGCHSGKEVLVLALGLAGWLL